MDDKPKEEKGTFGEELLKISEKYKSIEEKIAKLEHSITWHDDSIIKDREDLSRATMEKGLLGEKLIQMIKGGIPCAQ